jgi:endonuclease/exonuclease/phosphatase family metal-dependent hydrolase
MAALGIALAPALLKFANVPETAAIEVNEDAVAECTVQDDAPVHRRYQGTGDVEARLPSDAVVQVISTRKNWRHVAYVDGAQAATGWVTTNYLGECDTETPSRNDSESGGSSSPVLPNAMGLKIATFNIQNFGKTKLAKDDLVNQLVRIVRKYPLVAVQELSDKSNQVSGAFLDRVNGGGGTYDALISERSGEQPDDTTSQEQYAFYFDKSVLEAKSPGELFDDRSHDFFQREPYVAQFKVRASTFSFVIITIHTKPGEIGEIQHLDDVVGWARGKFPGEEDFIVLGDFNGGCSYVSPEELDELSIRNPDDYTWLVPDNADTNLATKACPYDRIVVTPPTATRFLRWGVDQAFTERTVSDHWPVWAEFRP